MKFKLRTSPLILVEASANMSDTLSSFFHQHRFNKRLKSYTRVSHWMADALCTVMMFSHSSHIVVLKSMQIQM